MSQPSQDARTTSREPVEVDLRDVWDDDLPVFIEYLRDPEAQSMVSSTVVDYSDTQAFTSHWSKLRKNEDAKVRTIVLAGRPYEVVGHISVAPANQGLQVNYWVDRAHWGRGIATTSLGTVLEEVSTRPIFANVARANQRGAAVLQRNGFKRVGDESGFDASKGRMIDDVIYRLG